MSSDTDYISKLESVNNFFKIPMYYNTKKKSINSNITQDLELLETIDSSCVPIYDYFVFNKDTDTDETTEQKNVVNSKILEQISEQYTTDVDYLKDQQKLLKKYQSLPKKQSSNKFYIDLFDEIKLNSSFKDKYGFIDWDMFEYLNRSQIFLTGLSLYNIISPLISLLIPIFIVIIPFLIIKLKGYQVTITEYIKILKTLASNNSIFKLFTNFNSVDSTQKIYLLVSAGFYIFSIYQNVISCFKFHENMKKIHNYFEKFSDYLDYTKNNIINFLSFSDSLPSLFQFNEILKSKLKYIETLYKRIICISKYDFSNYKKISELGYVMKLFYEIYQDDDINEILLYSIGFNAYSEIVDNISHNLKNKYINCVNLQDKNIMPNEKNNKKRKRNKETQKYIVKNNFNGCYYASLKYKNHVKNDVKLHKNFIITGPNASGKTTILKTTLINIIFSQQFGCGFFKTGNLVPYDNLHCYLNIPDTSGRDSLFQAEARRCKEILDAIEKTNETHFCVFDELYSGTNPEEAEESATSFMKFLCKNKNVSCMLTTHFAKICTSLATNKKIKNSQMKTIFENNNLVYNYKLIDGISTIKGGMTILKNMDYPDEITKK
jgi:DNA mismatch repair ATPase MutS|uniref:DNA mismatch repair proteins mutS family domain-containing protein n=1 Tax=viral metagenome TaxID=1070528 RepID=A0A6C0IMQ5_9ZZZZ